MKENFKSGFVTIIGRPNVGKSTLMNILVDGIKRTDGSIKYNGTEISKMGAK